MHVTNEKWNEIVEATKAGIARWKSNAEKHQVQDRFSVEVQDAGGYSLLITRHFASGPSDNRSIAREYASGEIRSATLKKKKGKIVGFSVKTPDPKAWARLADKPAEEIVKQLRLLRFVMLLSSRMEATRVEASHEH